MTEFEPLDAAIEDMMSRMSPTARKALASRIATDLRLSNAKRERANEQPDGTMMEPRKLKSNGTARTKRLRDRRTGVRRQAKAGKMFLRAPTPQYLRKEVTEEGAQVGFVGAMARIMRVHQLGLRDTVTRDPASPEVTYPQRVVIGIAPEDRTKVLERMAEHLER